MKGPFLIRRYIKDTKYFPNNKKKLIRHQIKVLLNNRIVQKDISRENMIYNAKVNKLYLIDLENIDIRGEDETLHRQELLLGNCYKAVDKICDYYTEGEADFYI